MIQDPNQSSFGLQPNVAAGIASFFVWLGGLIILLGKPPQQWVRFVAVQAIVMFLVFFVAEIALWFITAMLGIVHLWALWPIVFLVGMVIRIAYFIAWIIMTVKAFQGQAQRFPFISDLADRWVPASASL